MKETNDRFGSLYAAALRDYFAEGSEANLKRAYELGRRAIGASLGLVDLVALHHEAVDEVFKRKGGEAVAADVRTAGRFLTESLSPFEMTHRGSREALTALHRLNETLEEEIKRIAHALHDEAGQVLVSVHLALEDVARDLPPRNRHRLKEIRHLLDEIEKHLRNLSHELRPTILDDLGLVPALEFLSQGVAARARIPVTVEGPTERRLPFQVETALYRIAQEALRNATKHAAARRVEIKLRVETNAVRCSVRDDGCGFDVPAVLGEKGRGGLGLMGMRERLHALGGELRIDSGPGCGTELQITIPLEADDGDSRPARG